MALSKPISEMTDAEVLEEIRNVRERRAGRAAAIAAEKIAKASAPKEVKVKKEKLADDAITALLRNILADELNQAKDKK